MNRVNRYPDINIAAHTNAGGFLYERIIGALVSYGLWIDYEKLAYEFYDPLCISVITPRLAY